MLLQVPAENNCVNQPETWTANSGGDLFLENLKKDVFSSNWTEIRKSLPVVGNYGIIKHTFLLYHLKKI